MEQQPSGSPESEADRLIREAQERVQPLYDHMASRSRAVSPARVAIDHYLELAAKRANQPIENQTGIVEVSLPEGEDKV